jgi:phosphoglycolate phosphatase-like HAD superfamily hydrolase
MILPENNLVISNPVKFHFSDDIKYKKMQSLLTPFRGRMVSNLVRHTALDNSIRKVWYSIINSFIRLFTRKSNMPKYYKFRAFVAQKVMAELSRNRLCEKSYKAKNKKLRLEISDKNLDPTVRHEKKELLSQRQKNKTRILKDEEITPYVNNIQLHIANMRQYSRWEQIIYLIKQLIDIDKNNYEKVKELLAPFKEEDFAQAFLTNKNQEEAVSNLIVAIVRLSEECETEINEYEESNIQDFQDTLLKRIESIEQAVEEGKISEAIGASRLDAQTMLFQQAIKRDTDSIKYMHSRQIAHELAEPGCLIIQDDPDEYQQDEQV